MWNKITGYILFSYKFLAASVIVILVSFIIFPQPSNLIIIVVFLISAISFSVCFYIIRKKELVRVINAIAGIRNNSFKSADDIRLGNNLEELQGEMRLMFAKIKQDIDYLKKLEKIRTEFLANVSHELRTPIFAIQGYIETLLGGAIKDDAVNKKFLQKAIQHTQNLDILVNDLIDISMIESGEMRMSFRYFNLQKFFTELQNEFDPAAKEKRLQLTTIPVKDKLQVLGDRRRLKQVFSNLITNAINYTDSGTVELGAIEGKDSVILTVRDTGIGIPEAEKERIFERFYRIDKARSKTAGGTGLGLAIVKHIIEAHGSKIEVNTRIGEGSEFRFRLKK